MSWQEITFDVPDDLKDAVVGELSEQGAAGVWEAEEPSPGITRLVVYFSQGVDVPQVVGCCSRLFERSNSPAPSVQHAPVQERDWTEEWKKSYRSFPIGQTFFVIPSWSESRCPEDRLPIHIDPGQAFGTGTHETTQLTLEALERWVEPRHVVLDLGTGSGILAIASRMLGAKTVLACDVDPVAAQVAYENIGRNAEPDVWTVCGTVEAMAAASVDLLLCNLTADLIVSNFPEIHRAVRPSGIAILSGILNEQREEIRDLMDTFGYVVHEEKTRGEWLALVAQKHVD